MVIGNGWSWITNKISDKLRFEHFGRSVIQVVRQFGRNVAVIGVFFIKSRRLYLFKFFLISLVLMNCPIWAQAGPLRGIYVSSHAIGQGRSDSLVSELLVAGGNAIVFDVKDRRGRLSYESKVPLAVEMGASQWRTLDDPVATIKRWQDMGIYVIARMTCFYDLLLAGYRPEWVPRSRAGGLWGEEEGLPNWVDPSVTDAQDYLIELAIEVSSMGVDEIQLDYVRFPTEGNLNDAIFLCETKMQTKDVVITNFVRDVRSVLRPQGVRLSVDIFGVTAWGQKIDALRLGQSVKDLLKHVDAVSPMLYPSHFGSGFGNIPKPVDFPHFLVNRGCERLRELAASSGVDVRPWLQAFDHLVSDFNSTFITEQMHGAEEGGAYGWLLWNSASQYVEGFDAIHKMIKGNTITLSDLARNPHH